MLIEAKVKVARNVDSKIRKRTETYLMDREFFSEAEYAISSEMAEEQASHLVESFEIQSLRVSPVREIALPPQSSGECTFIATLKDTWLEEDGTEKSLRYKVLLWADNLTEANQTAHNLAREGYDMVIEGIKEVEYYYIQPEENEEQSGE